LIGLGEPLSRLAPTAAAALRSRVDCMVLLLQGWHVCSDVDEQTYCEALQHESSDMPAPLSQT
jgi:hypothetical protein